MSVSLSTPQLLMGTNGVPRAEICTRVTIAHLDVAPRNRVLTQPFPIASDDTKVTAVDNVTVTMRSPHGVTGLGEGAPFQGISGDTQDLLLADVRQAIPDIVGRALNVFELETVLRNKMRFPAARAAIEMAFWNLLASAERIPLVTLLNPHVQQPEPLQSDVTIPLVDAEASAAMARKIWAAGCDRLKIKVGDGIGSSYQRVMAAHGAIAEQEMAGRQLTILLDANEGYGPRDAVTLVQRLESQGIPVNVFEQPIRRNNIDGLPWLKNQLNNMAVLLFADEAVYTLEDARRVIAKQTVDGINLKTMKHGGLLEAMRIAEYAYESGIKLMIGGMVETTLSMGVSMQLAQALGHIYWVDLDTPLFMQPHVDDGPIDSVFATNSLASY